MFNFPARLVTASVITTACAAISAGHAQTPPAHLHVELTITTAPCINSYGSDTQPASFCADTSDVHSHNFVLSQSGQSLPFRLTRPSDKAKEPVHMLLIAPAQSAAEIWAAASHELAQAWARGWLVSIAGSDRQTAYTGSESELAAAIQSGATTSPAADAGLQQLQSFAGRRILLVAGTTTRPRLTLYTQSIPEVYVVDGGVPTSSTFGSTYLFEPCYSGDLGNNQNCSVHPYSPWVQNVELTPAIATNGIRTGFLRGAWHEKSLDRAFKQAAQNSKNYFDLEADVLPSAFGSGFNLQFRKLPDGLRLKADIYAERDGQREEKPRLVLSQR